MEFIGFYNQTPELVKENLSGAHENGGENTAVYDSDKTTIRWDLKNRVMWRQEAVLRKFILIS